MSNHASVADNCGTCLCSPNTYSSDGTAATTCAGCSGGYESDYGATECILTSSAPSAGPTASPAPSATPTASPAPTSSVYSDSWSFMDSFSDSITAQKYHTAQLASNGKIYLFPKGHTQIMIVDTADDSYAFLDGYTDTTTYKFERGGSVVASNGLVRQPPTKLAPSSQICFPHPRTLPEHRYTRFHYHMTK